MVDVVYDGVALDVEDAEMKTSPNEDAPQLDVEFIIEELLNLYNEADEGGYLELKSRVGCTFHARVVNAAKHLGLVFIERDVKA